VVVPKPKQKSERAAAFAKGGGANKMFSKQAANSQKPGGTAHNVRGAAPGASSAKGGSRTSGHSMSMPAKASHTAPVRKGRLPKEK
jgi:hypothetical protein